MAPRLRWGSGSEGSSSAALRNSFSAPWKSEVRGHDLKLAIFLDSRSVHIAIYKGASKIHAHVKPLRINTLGFAKFTNRRVEVAFLLQLIGQVIAGGDVIRIER